MGNPSAIQSHLPAQDSALAPKKTVMPVSPLFPFSASRVLAAIGGPTYVTPQTLVQQVAYTLSDKLFTFSPEKFALDCAVKQWAIEQQENASGKVTAVNSMETRLGAGSALLGYTFSKDKTSTKELPQSIIASTGSLPAMQSALNQLSLLYTVSSPVVAHVAAVDYDPTTGKLVTDYISAVRIARETGLGLVTSTSSHEAQHMALFATLAATVLPTVHIYDGIRVARESTRVVDVMDQNTLAKISNAILKEHKEVGKRVDEVTRVSQILQSVNSELGTAYSFFEYEGHSNPDAVLVVFGSVEASLAAQVAASLGRTDKKVGVISVRVANPFSESHFIQALPKTVQRVVILGQVHDQLAVQDHTVQSPLFEDVFSAVIMSDSWSLPPPVLDVKYSREQEWSPTHFAWILSQISRPTFKPQDLSPHILAQKTFTEHGPSLPSDCSQYVFWNLDDACTANSPAIFAKVLSADSSMNVGFAATYDNGPEAGVIQSELRVSRKVLEAPYHIHNADVTVVNDTRLLSSFDVLAGLKQGGTLLLVSNISEEDFEKKLPADFRRLLVTKSISLYNLNTPEASQVEDVDAFGAVILQLAVIQIIGANAPQLLMSMLNYFDSATVYFAAQELEKSLRKIDTPKSWAEQEPNESISLVLPSTPATTSFTLNSAKHEVEPVSYLKTPQVVAQALSFKEAFGTAPALRPDLPVKNFVVKVRENKRLTPDYYDRNVFHIEFDISGTGLTYNIGEALGVHAYNDSHDVLEFINWYGLNSETIAEVPSREDPENVLEVRTVYQALLQNIDIFGRPPKKFYESLAEYATDEAEKKALVKLASPEGAQEFKRRAEIDTVTYADILHEFPSARPEFYDLVKIVSPLKRREYSIASAQIVNPDSVHLLIVEVNWVDTKGRTRFGQATRYLSRLPLGSEVTVSVKPSVMKLPHSSSAPLIMAGLGTGLAPFRAFCQYRAWQKSQGEPIGPILLYMGSRHQREEYLYGEEWEAYKASGIITLLGTAFSRDQKHKIYIQDRMRQSIAEIVDCYVKEEGSFYLCGPTWPVPDVAAVLMEAIAQEASERGAKVDARKRLEELKEHERYILEVY